MHSTIHVPTSTSTTSTRVPAQNGHGSSILVSPYVTLASLYRVPLLSPAQKELSDVAIPTEAMHLGHSIAHALRPWPVLLPDSRRNHGRTFGRPKPCRAAPVRGLRQSFLPKRCKPVARTCLGFHTQHARAGHRRDPKATASIVVRRVVLASPAHDRFREHQSAIAGFDVGFGFRRAALPCRRHERQRFVR